MTRFPADWLQRREPYDRLARNPSVLAALTTAFADAPAITVVDLACGVGASVRAISAALPAQQRWRLIDNDLSLLARAKSESCPAIVIDPRPIDLACDLEAAIDGPVDLVTTSAFLDLVSGPWLERLVIELAARRLPFYAALSYDGRVVFDPADDFDPVVVAAFNQHQRTDKGFGPALGPAAAVAAIGRFRQVGYDVTDGPADWIVASSGDIYGELLDAFVHIAEELIGQSAALAGWIARRKIQQAAGRASLRIGHRDFFARPTTQR